MGLNRSVEETSGPQSDSAIRTEQMRAAAEAALRLVAADEVLGIGSGRTAAVFVDVLAESAVVPPFVLAASRETAALLSSRKIDATFGSVPQSFPLYVDGVDEIDGSGRTIKGRGGAHTMEKLLATAAKKFVCIADESKPVSQLGQRAPVPLEVLPSSVRLVLARLELMGATARVRTGVTTDSGMLLIDAEGLDLRDPLQLEYELDAIPGVIECGIFAHRRADMAFIGTSEGVRQLCF